LPKKKGSELIGILFDKSFKACDDLSKELFSDEKKYTVHYIEALGGVDPHRDPWIYDSDYKNIIFYDNLPEDAKLKINGDDILINSPQHTNFGNDIHSYQFKTRPFPLKILHIDYEDELR